MTNHEKTPKTAHTPRYTQPSARATQGQPSHPIRGLFMASLTFSLAAALTACWSATPQPIISTTRSLNDAFQITNVQAFNTGVNSQGATGATASSTGISINFDQAVNRASVEQSVNIFEGEINHDTNPTPNQFTKLGLTSMCNGYWRVRNPNTVPISFTWDVFKTPENGAGVVQANSDTFFTSSLNADTIRVHVNNKQQQVKAKNPAACTSSALSFAWAADSKSVVASPKTALVLNKTYSVVVSTFAKNSSGSAALSVPYVSKVVVQENSSTSGILVPGGSFTSRDGVRIVAPIGSISSPVEISVVKRNEPAESFGELANVFEPIAIYKVSSNPIAEVDSELLQLYFPVPNTANLDDYVLLQLGSVDGTTAASSGSGAKSWSYVHRNYEKRTEILEEDGVLNFDFYMIARTSVIKTPKKALSINSVSIPSFFPDCFGVENCDDLSAQVQSILKTEYSVLINQLGLDDTVLLNRIILKKSQIDLFDKDCGNDTFAYYDSMKSKLQFCIDVEMNGTVVNGKLRSGNYLSKTVRHELFHALQFEKLFRAGVRAENPNSFTYLGQYPPNLENKVYYNVGRRWILEGTATAIEYSDLSKFNRQTRGYDEGIPDRDLFKSTSTLKENKSPVVLENDMYETQDFWVFSGQNTFRKSKWNLNYLLTIFSSGLKTAFPTQELDATFQILGYPGGLKSAYWEWSKNQSYERFENLENLNSAPCSANLSTTFPDFSKRVAQDGFRPPIYVEDLSKALTYNFAGNSDQIKDKPFTVSSLTTEVISVKFLNAINNGVNVSFKSQGDFKYKIYRTDQPLPTPDACKDFKDAENSNPVFPITPGTKLFILAANIDLENSSSFTVTVTPVTTNPNIKQQTPNGLQDVIEQPVYLQGVAGQTMTTTLVLTNEGAIGTSMEYTLQPIGNHITSGVSAASIRNPVSTPTGTAQMDVWNSSLFQTRTGKLRAPNDPDVINGADKLEIPVSAKCPEAGGLLRTNLEFTYNTGLMDDYSTPNNPNDDQPELEVKSIPLTFFCLPFQASRISRRIDFVKQNGSIATCDSAVPEPFPNSPEFSMIVNGIGLARDGTLWSLDVNTNTVERILETSDISYLTYGLAVLKDGGVAPIQTVMGGSIMMFDRLPGIENVAMIKYPFVLKRDGTLFHWDLISSLVAKQTKAVTNSLEANESNNRLTMRNQTPLHWPIGLRIADNLISSKSIRASDVVLRSIENMSNVRYVSASYPEAYILKNDGTVWKMNLSTLGATATKIEGLNNVVSIDAGYNNFLAVKDDGTVWGIGEDSFGIVSGDGIGKFLEPGESPYRIDTLTQTQGLQNIKAVAFPVNDVNSALAIKSDGGIWQWGFDCIGNTKFDAPPTVQPPTFVTNIR
jgi:hypothetical protein